MATDILESLRSNVRREPLVCLAAAQEIDSMRLIMLNPFVSLFHAMDWIGLTVLTFSSNFFFLPLFYFHLPCLLGDFLCFFLL